jgi:hypothetical protein
MMMNGDLEDARALQMLEETAALLERVLTQDADKAAGWDLDERGRVFALLAWQAMSSSDHATLLAAVCTAGVFGFVRGYQAGLLAGRAEVLERMVGVKEDRGG